MLIEPLHLPACPAMLREMRGVRKDRRTEGQERASGLKGGVRGGVVGRRLSTACREPRAGVLRDHTPRTARIMVSIGGRDKVITFSSRLK